MNKGITSKQVEEALGLDGTSTSVTVSEWARRGGAGARKSPHRYEVVIDGDMDISMAELQSLVALFGTVHVCGKYTQPDRRHPEDGNFYFEVSE